MEPNRDTHLTPADAAARGKTSMVVEPIQIAGLEDLPPRPSQGLLGSSSLQAPPDAAIPYLQDLQAKINELAYNQARDRGLREEIAEIKRLLRLQTSDLVEGSGRRSPSARDRQYPAIEAPPNTTAPGEGARRRRRTPSPEPRYHHADPRKRSVFTRLTPPVEAASSSYPNEHGRAEGPTLSKKKGKGADVEEIQTAAYRERKEREREEREYLAQRQAAKEGKRHKEREPANDGVPHRAPHEANHRSRRERQERDRLMRDARHRDDYYDDRREHSPKYSYSSGHSALKKCYVRDERLDRLSSSPFSRAIDDFKPPKGFTQPKFAKYDGKTDAYSHLLQYKHIMGLFTFSDELMCRVFPASLGELGLIWFNQLPPRSIDSYDDLCSAFLSRFVTSNKHQKEIDSLLALRKKPEETLRQYATRYWEMFNDVEGCDDVISAKSFKLGLGNEDEAVYDDLARNKPSSMTDLMVRVEQWCQLIESKQERGLMKKPKGGPHAASSNAPSGSARKQVNTVKEEKPEKSGKTAKKGPKPSDFNAIETVFTIPIYRIIEQIKDEPFFQFPAEKMGTEGGKVKSATVRCSYHQEQGHFTTACRPFKAYLEQLVAAGHIRDLIDDDRTAQRAARRPPPPQEEARPINVIHGPVPVSSSSPSQPSHASALNRVMLVGQESKRARTDTGGAALSFSSRDLEKVQRPHNDALVVTLRIRDCNVARVLVDQGSSVEVMYYNLFSELGLKESDLEDTTVPLIGFGGSPVWPLGRITLPVRAGSVTVRIEFIVIEAPGPYNAILGRSWLHAMEAVASSFHQVVKFIGTTGRVEELRGNQMAARKCHVNAVSSKSASTKRVLAVEIPDAPVLEDVGTTPVDRSVEELITVPINEDGSRYFLVGSEMSEHEREQMIQFLRNNIEVFAWTPYEMPGVDPSIACHSLNVEEGRRPVVQKARRSSPAHAEAVIEEVKRLLDANAIQEVQYPTWLANTVVVKKKNGKWRVCVDYTNLNDACPKDFFPLPRIDQLVDATSGHARLSFMDAYRGYHQIPMKDSDIDKTAFITPRGIYGYRVMPFGLKNAGATYQAMVTKMFAPLLGDSMEAYIDDMVVKSRLESDHLAHLTEVFNILREHKLRLNAEKCVFGVGSGKFLGHLVTRRGIEADPSQITAIQNLETPRNKKDIQKLTGMAAALNRFISRSSDRCRHFFNLLKGSRRGFTWTPECDQAFAQLKQYMSEAPLLVTPRGLEDLLLYLAVSPHAVSSVLVRQEGADHQPIYYSSRTMTPAQTRYLPLEKLALALVTASRKLTPYFQAHRIIVLTEFPLKSLLRKADLSNRISKWAVELANYDIRYQPRTAIKAQALADFIAEFSPGNNAPPEASTSEPQPNPSEEPSTAWKIFHGDIWKLYVDGASNARGAGAGIVLQSPCGVVHETALTLDFPASNNEAEYEALLAGLETAIGLGIEEIIVYSDSQLVVNQLNAEYEARDERMRSYLALARNLIAKFPGIRLEHVNRDQNSHADALAGLASACSSQQYRSVSFRSIPKPSFELAEDNCEVFLNSLGPSWMDDIVAFLKDQKVPEDSQEMIKLQKKARMYWLDHKTGFLYRRSYTGPYLRVAHPSQVGAILYDLHAGPSGCHSGGRSLAHRALTSGYWWPTMKQDAEALVKKCVSCQMFSPIIHAPARELTPITSPWPFAQWGLDLVGPLPVAPGGFKFLITATDYFTKWVEAEPLVHIEETDVIRFLWRNIISRFGVPHAIVSDNGKQFVGQRVVGFLEGHGIKCKSSTPGYPQGNGQAEASNKSISAGLKKRLERKRGKWAEELPNVLWAYRTTPRRSTGRTPFSLAFGMEAVIPIELGITTLRVDNFEASANDEAAKKDLDLAEEGRESARIKLAAYQQEVARGYNRRVRKREFNPDDLVMKKVIEKSKKKKFMPNYEGPFKVVKHLGLGNYKLEQLDGTPIAKSWNISNLRIYNA